MFWNKETRRPDGTYYRQIDWGVPRTTKRTEDFTEISPPQEAFNGVPVDWIDGAWVIARAEAYKKMREISYASIADQLDMQYHDLVNGTTTWRDSITSVKEAYPKPIAERRNR